MRDEPRALAPSLPIESQTMKDISRIPPSGRPLRVAMVAACPFPYPRGTPVRIQRMAEALVRRGHEVHVVTYHLGRAMEDKGVHVHRIPNVRSYSRVAPGPSWQKLLLLDPLLFLELRRLLRRFSFDVIHAHHYEGLLVAKAQLSRTPVVYDAHTLLSSELPFYGRDFGARMKRSLGWVLDRYLPGRASHVVAVTDRIQDRLVEMGAVRAERITVVGNGVGTAQFDEAIPLEYKGARTVIFTGNLATYQGIVPLLHAFRDVSRQRPNVRLQIVSESPFDDYEQLARSLGIRGLIDIVNVGFEDLPPYLVSADVAVNPRPEADGIPQKLMNYMAASRPIVSFEGSAAHLVNEKTALLVPGQDVTAFAAAIVRLLDDPPLARRLGAAARLQVESSFSWDRTARLAEEVYAKVMHTRRRSAPVRQPERGVTGQRTTPVASPRAAASPQRVVQGAEAR